MNRFPRKTARDLGCKRKHDPEFLTRIAAAGQGDHPPRVNDTNTQGDVVLAAQDDSNETLPTLSTDDEIATSLFQKDAQVIEICQGKGLYKGYANKVFLAFLEGYKSDYKGLPKGKGERKKKREFQMERYNQVSNVLGLRFKEETDLKPNKKHKSTLTEPGLRLERKLNKISKVLCRETVPLGEGLDTHQICVGASVDPVLLQTHAPNVVFRHMILCNKRRYESISNVLDREIILRDIFSTLKDQLHYRMMERSGTHHDDGVWTEMSDDDALAFLSQELGPPLPSVPAAAAAPAENEELSAEPESNRTPTESTDLPGRIAFCTDPADAALENDMEERPPVAPQAEQNMYPVPDEPLHMAQLEEDMYYREMEMAMLVDLEDLNDSPRRGIKIEPPEIQKEEPTEYSQPVETSEADSLIAALSGVHL